MKRTKIVATIGPASEDEQILRELILSGVNVCRLNFSHGNHEEHKKRIDIIKKLRRELNIPVAIMLDTKGPEIRLGDFKKEVDLKLGDTYTLTPDEYLGDEKKAEISYKELYKDVAVGDRILIDDGLVELCITEIKDRDIITEVRNYGTISAHKGINVPSANLNLPILTDRDVSDLLFGVKEDIDFVAVSFVRSAEDVLAIRKVLEDAGDFSTKIISKIESKKAVELIDEIIEVSDGIMVARGDLGVEIETEKVPMVQKNIIKKCNDNGKAVITATQMLDSMIRNPRPTRAETNDVANAVLDGSSAVMLSGETASGKYPVDAVKTMNKILEYTEISLNHDDFFKFRVQNMDKTMTNSIGKSACEIAEELDAKAIIAATTSGNTSRAISKFRPKVAIIASTPFEKIKNQLSLEWGVTPIKIGNHKNTDTILEASIEAALSQKLVNTGDTVILTAGIPVGIAGSTNLLKVEAVSEIIGRGTAIGKEKITARAVVINSESDYENFRDGDIIIANSTDKEMITMMKNSQGFVTEEAGFTSHGAITAISLEKTAIVGLENATIKIETGDIITIDPADGTVRR
ncbi:pyruvate kinase [Peptoniphilus olsenii]|uniref:Pyruvate kinase n=1 Tax=Peptoniphilus olsenii TaxID=411570 RepID=A0ABV2JAY2_9FIRM